MVILKFGKGQSVRMDEPKSVVDEVTEFFGSEETPATESVKVIAEAVAERGEQYDAENGIDSVATVELVDDDTNIEADEQEAATGNESTTPQPIPDLQPSYQEQLDDARNEFTEISLETAACEAQMKILKAESRASLKRLKNLIDRGAAVSTTVAVSAAKFAPDDADEQLTTKTQSAVSDAWRAAPIADLDLGKTLTEKLSENGIETLGELEDLRAKICDRKAEWPKGIGEAKITKIEDAVIEWLQKNQQAFVAEKSESEPELMTVPADQAGSQIVNRADELNTGEPGALDCSDSDSTDTCHLATIYSDGMSAKSDGIILADCPHEESGASQDAWLRGWLRQREIELVG